MKKSAIIINLLGIFIFCFILLGAYAVQFIYKELPCPLCLMQRMAMIGVGFGLALNLRYGIKSAHYGISILSALLGACISIRHILLHICTIGSGYGTPVLGLHLYTWALLIFLISILVIALLLLDVEELKGHEIITFDLNTGLEKLCKNAIWILLFIALANFFTTLLICGIGPCPDDPVSYQLLEGKWF